MTDVQLSLIAHGGPINMLKVHPTDESLIYSASKAPSNTSSPLPPRVCSVTILYVNSNRLVFDIEYRMNQYGYGAHTPVHASQCLQVFYKWFQFGELACVGGQGHTSEVLSIDINTDGTR